MKKMLLIIIFGLISRLFKAVGCLFKNKIKVIFLINDPYTNNFISLYRVLEKDKRFEVLVVACDHLSSDFAPAFSRNLISEILTEANIKHRIGINILEIAKLGPDFIFTSNLYDMYSRHYLRSEYLSALGHLIHISYGAVLIKWEGKYKFLAQNPYLNRAYKIFVESDLIFPGNSKFEPIGYLKLDEYIHYGRKPQVFKGYSVAWKPRWTNADDSNAGKFINYFLEFSAKRENILNIIIHPLLRTSFARMPEGKEILEKFNIMKQRDNVNFIEKEDFLDYVLGSDVYIGDISSTLAEFLWTGKPIVYIDSKLSLNLLGEAIISTCYVVESEGELEEILTNLKFGNDPKTMLRKNLFQTLFHVKTSQSVAEQIRDYILKDK